MITQQQFKQAKLIESEIDELSKFLKELSSKETTMAIAGTKPNCFSFGPVSARFNIIQRDLITELNNMVIVRLSQKISVLHERLSEHVTSTDG